MIDFQDTTISPSFEPGDIVVLRSGGPDMTVIEMDAISGRLRCWWMNSDGFTDEADFLPQCLEKI
jgi:uncharacterized protein YodC (DUF2158 family)